MWQVGHGGAHCGGARGAAVLVAPEIWRRPWHCGSASWSASSYGVTKGWSSIWRELCKNATLPPDYHPKDGKKNSCGKQVPGT